MATFVLIWFGQLISTIGSGLTGFALGIWVYQSAGSVMQFSLIYFFAELPGILIAPLAGAIADRYDRRKIMLLSNVSGGICTVLIAGLLVAGWLSLWKIYCILIVSSIARGFQKPAYYAIPSSLLNKQKFGHAGGMVQLAQASGQLFSPILAGLLVPIIQIPGILLIDIISFIVAFVTLLLSQVPHTKTVFNGMTRTPLLQEIQYGWMYIAKRSGLLVMMAFFAVINFNIGLTQVLITPMVLNFANTQILGVILSIGGSGWLLGSLIMSVWGGTKSRMLLILSSEMILGLGILIMGLRPDPVLIAVANFVSFFSLSLILASTQAIWQSKIPLDVQARVLAIRSMAAWIPFPLAYLAAGVLAEKVYEPLLSPNGLLSSSVGLVIGVGPGRGIGLLFVTAGLLIMGVTAFAFQYVPLRYVEKNLPDMFIE